jgi:multiple sugar transport system ATP-binding protein
VPAGATSVTLGDTPVTLPALREPASGRLVLGVRPEHLSLSDSAPYRGRIEAAEYLGTTQIVTLSTPHGTVRARTPAGRAARPGDTTGLGFDARTLSLFDAGTGRALRTAANAGVHHG